MEGLLVSYVSDEESDSEQNPISSLLPKYVAADDDDDEEEEDNRQQKQEKVEPYVPPVVVPDPPLPLSTPNSSATKPETSAETAPVVKTKKKKASKWAAISASIKKETKEKAVQVSSSSSALSDPLQGPQGPPRETVERDDRLGDDEEMFDDDEEDQEDEDWGGYFETPGSLELQSLGKELLQTPLPLPNYLSDLVPLGECSTEVKQKLHGLFDAKRRGRSINDNISLQPSFKHPKIVGRLAMVRGIHEKLSAFPPEIYNPNRFHPSEYFPELDKEVLYYEEQKKIEQQKRTRIEFTREREPVSVGGQPTPQFNQQPPVFQDNYARFFAASRVSAASADLDEPSNSSSSSSSSSKKRLRSPPTSPPPVRSSKWDAKPRK